MVNMLPRESTTSNHPDILVSIVVPAYNAEKYIADTLKSVLAQTYKNFEVIIVDDGSIDSTADIVRDFTQTDSRFRLLKQANAGVAAARNMGIRHAKGEFIAPLDADDIWYSHHLEKQVLCLAKSSETVALVYSWSVDIDERGRLLGGINVSSISGYVHPTLICGNFLGNASSCMVRKSVIDGIGYDVSLRERGAQGCEDWDLYLRIAERYMFNVVPECSVGYRKPVSSMSSDYDQMARSHAFVMEAVRQRNQRLPRFPFRLSASNLYLYFAHQCQAKNQQQKTIRWMRRTILADPLTCWIRPGLYILLIRVFCLPIVYKSQERKLDHSQPISPNNVLLRRARIRIMVFVGSVFHFVIRLLTSKPTSLLQNLKVLSGAKTC